MNTYHKPILFGVCAKIADKFGIDASFIRGALCVFALFLPYLFAIYCICAAILLVSENV